jgi:hypothetical protein
MKTAPHRRQFYEYHNNPQNWSNELRLASKPGGRLHWLGGLYWAKSRDKDSGSTFFTPGLNGQPRVRLLQQLLRHDRFVAAAHGHLRLPQPLGLSGDDRVRERKLRPDRPAERRGRRGAFCGSRPV